VINAALLHKSCAFKQLDAVIFVRAPALVRMFRARKRDGLSWKEIRRRFSSQQFAVHYSSETADIYYIDNGGSGIFSRSNRRVEKVLAGIIDSLPL
jgi:dephospho-CoA kinase